MKTIDTNRFKGVVVALNACYDQNGDISRENTKRLVEWYIKLGVQGLYVCGSTGEGCMLSVPERMAVCEAACEAGKEELTIIVHVGAPATKDSCALAAHAQQCGAHAVSAVPSIFYRHSEAAIENHWNEITKASELPFLIYNIPQLTGYNLSTALFEKMLKNDKVIGVKNSAEVSHQIMDFKARGGEGFLVYNGPDEQYLAGRIMGADGGIGGTYGPMPELYLRLEELIVEGKIKEAEKLQKDILFFIYRLCAFPSLYGANKAVIKVRSGIDLGQPRLPFLPVDPNSIEIIQLASDIEKCVSEWL